VGGEHYYPLNVDKKGSLRTFLEANNFKIVEKEEV
jgi:hypothetical protein